MKSNKSSGGFTLTELMIAVAIIGIIAAIGYPSYQNYVRESRRAEGRNMLLDAANRQERYFADNNAYTSNMTQLGYGADPAISENSYYSVDATSTATSYDLTATAQGVQAGDSGCATLTYSSTGAKGSTGGDTCW